jgi:RimJ/RimL family protein N-acetyltransferase
MSAATNGPISFPDAPITRGPVRLRRFNHDDASGVVTASHDPWVIAHTYMPEHLDIVNAQEWIDQVNARWESGHGRVAIANAHTDELEGQVGLTIDFDKLSADIYFWLLPEVRQNGLAVTAVGAMAEWAFDVAGVERLVLISDLDDEESHDVAARCGFVHEGVLRAYEPFRGERPDVVSYSLLPDDRRPWQLEWDEDES